MKTWEAIPGWFDFDNLYSEWVTQAEDGFRFVEIGCWLGRSTAYMGEQIKNSKKRISFFAVDTWQGSLGEAKLLEFVSKSPTGSIYPEFLMNMAETGVLDWIKPICLDSVIASELFEDDSLDLVFIDASHKYEDVKKDIELWYPKVRPEGILAGHDYVWQTVQQAVTEKFNDIITLNRSSWIHYKSQSKELQINSV